MMFIPFLFTFRATMCPSSGEMPTLGTCYSVWMTVWYAYQTVIHTE